MADKRTQMMEFWSQRSRAHGSDPRANTNDVHLRRLEIDFVAGWIERTRPTTVLDFGCANGYTTLQLAQQFPAIQFLGIDLNSDMIDVARQSAEESGLANVEFRHGDILNQPLRAMCDFIFAVRVFQNMDSFEMQTRVAESLLQQLHNHGALLYIESYSAEYKQLNADRVALGLSPLPIHEHLTLLTPAFDEFVSQRLELMARESPSSSYYLITRLVYSALAQELQQPIDYDHPLHRLAAQVPQIGSYGPQWACVFRKREDLTSP